MQLREVFSKKRMVAFVGVAALSLGMVVPALAQDTVTQEVTPGTLTASIADADLTTVPYSHTNQTPTGTLSLTADDSTGSDDGWNVTVLAGNFVDGANSIPAANFSLTGYGTLAVNAGQAVDGTGGPNSGIAGPVALDTARMVLDADAGFGKGNYTQPFDVSLLVPGQTLAGEYVSALTVTISSGPGE